MTKDVTQDFMCIEISTSVLWGKLQLGLRTGIIKEAHWEQLLVSPLWSLFASSDPMFFPAAQEWLTNRGYHTKLYIPADSTLFHRLLSHVVLWAVRSVWNQKRVASLANREE